MVVEKLADTRRCFVSRVVVEFHREGLAVPRHNPSGSILRVHFLSVIKCPISGAWFLTILFKD